MKRFIVAVLMLGGIAASGTLYAQSGKEKKADKFFESYSYVRAIDAYERLVKKRGNKTLYLRRLAESYKSIGEMHIAGQYYQKLMRAPDKTADDVYNYATVLRGRARYKESMKWMLQFAEMKPNDIRGQLHAADPEYYLKLKEIEDKFTVKAIKENSKFSDFGPTYYGKNLVFSSAREGETSIKRAHSYNEQPFYDLYMAPIKRKGRVGPAERFANRVNTKYHEGPVCFNREGNKMFFTRNNYFEGKIREDEEGVTNLKIFYVSFAGGKWSEESPMPFNSDDYSCGHASLSVDGKRLYFSSDMPGGKGGVDIYYVESKGNNQWGEPINVEDVNTEGDEMFPYIHPDGTLFFASNGRPGLGGLDVFMRAVYDENDIEVKNLGFPLNTKWDDFGMIIDEKLVWGYLASNRANNDDDIYSFKVTGSLYDIVNFNLMGIVTNLETDEVIEGVNVTIVDNVENDSTVLTALTDPEGVFKKAFEGEKRMNEEIVYTIYLEKKGYLAKNVTFRDVLKEEKTYKLHEELDLRLQPIALGSDLAKIVDVKSIYYDLGSANLREESKSELDKIVKAMNDNPDITIELGSHTDARGSKKFNERLSESRAASARNYIISQGIPAQRITSKGYGEYRLVNRCKDGVRCSEEDHQANRRTEFIVTGM